MALTNDGAVSAVNSFTDGTTPTTTGTLTTTAGSGRIIVASYSSTGTTCAAPTATGLTFAARQSQVGSGGALIQTWEAPFSSNFSGTISALCGASSFHQLCVFAIGGADTGGSPFDGNASVPNHPASGDPAVTTSNANDFIYAIEATTGSGPTAGTGFTEFLPFTFLNFMCQYKIVSATGTYTATLGSGGPAIGAVMDAIKQATGGGGPAISYGNLPLLGV